jgi:putative oxidoreductase
LASKLFYGETKMTAPTAASRALESTNQGLDWLAPLFQLALRFYVAYAFLLSGLTKIADFSSTVALFENEYHVPLLSPLLAAYMGTAAEFVLPALFALGLVSRPTAIAFFVFNAVAVLSYPDISPAGVKDHMVWGTMMLVILFFGAGRFSLDRLISNRWQRVGA